MSDASDLVISVVIPAYKRPDLLRGAVLSAVAQDLPPDQFEVIVVDSSPDDANERLVRELMPDAPCDLFVHRKAPEGPGPSRSMGAERARGRFIAFLDSDCQATPGWLRAALAAFEDEIGFVQGRTRPNPEQSLGVLTHYVHIETESHFYETCNIVYRREALEEAGRFPRDMTANAEWPTGGEDTLVAWKVKRNGWQSRFAPEALVHHEVLPATPWFWLCNKRLFMLPSLVAQVPELRRYFYGGYFYEKAQAALVVALASVVLATLSPIALLGVVPYVIVRSSEGTRTLTGLRRLMRPVFYLPRDLISLALLSAGSLRYRSILV